MSEKYAAEPTEGESTPEYKKTYCTSLCPPRLCYRVRASWRLKKILEMSTLSFHADMVGGMLPGLLISYPVCCSSRFITKHPSRAATRRGSADYNWFTIHVWWRSVTFLGVFAKFRKATSSFVVSVHPSVRPSVRNNSAPTWRIFMKFDIWGFFENPSRKFKFH
jgi:hypothetical protein